MTLTHVYDGELARSYLTIVKDLSRVMNRLKALYRGWGIACSGTQVYAARYREGTFSIATISSSE